MCRVSRISQVNEVNVWAEDQNRAPLTPRTLTQKQSKSLSSKAVLYKLCKIEGLGWVFLQHHYLSRRNESQAKDSRSLYFCCHLSEQRNNSCYSFTPCSVSLFLCAFPKEDHGFQLLSSPLFPNSWLAGSLISSRTRRIGSGLEVWHCHNVGGDETALRPTLLNLTWLILGGRCYSTCCTFHPPPIDRHENYSQGKQSACKLISVSAHTQTYTHVLNR